MTDDNAPTEQQGPRFERQPEQEIEISVRDDIVDGLSEWFDPAPDSFRLNDDLHAQGTISNRAENEDEVVTAVVWQYEAQPRSEIWGVAADRTVLVHGATFVSEQDDSMAFTRFIDWHGVFAELGVAAAGRIVAEPSGDSDAG